MIKIVFFILLLCNILQAQILKVSKVEPPNWWINMKWNKVQLMVYGTSLQDIKAQFDTNEIRINKIYSAEKSRYAFIDIDILPTISAGNYILSISNQNESEKINFSIYDRNSPEGRYQGFDNRDVVYLITPDRFVNGNVENDNIEGMRDHVDRNDILRRHGGDIQGIIDKLEYIRDMGFTTVWINPLIENDMDISYHGYAATDLYKIDPRFGSNELYRQLVEKAHRLGLKIILDHVSNHVGMYHQWVKEPPFSNWFHGTPDNHLHAYHDKKVLFDIYATELLKEKVKDGWFVKEMPDLNQENSFLKNYLIQNTLWWVESFGIDGIREDTYPYVNQEFLTDWADAIFNEYPDLNIVGEVWIHDPAYLAGFQGYKTLRSANDTRLPSVTDFGLLTAMESVLRRNQSIYNIYNLLGNDFVYTAPEMLLTFVDNHDIMRLWDMVSGDIERYKLALTLLLTTRGIPQIYYGTEIGIIGGDDHGLIRRDFPGGFEADKFNKFTKNDRNSLENEIFDYLKQLLSLRKKYKSLTEGKLTHIPPSDEIYTFFRNTEYEKIMIIINNNDHERIIDLNIYEKYYNTLTSFKDLINGNVISRYKNFSVLIPAKGVALLLENR